MTSIHGGMGPAGVPGEPERKEAGEKDEKPSAKKPISKPAVLTTLRALRAKYETAHNNLKEKNNTYNKHGTYGPSFYKDLTKLSNKRSDAFLSLKNAAYTAMEHDNLSQKDFDDFTEELF